MKFLYKFLYTATIIFIILASTNCPLLAQSDTLKKEYAIESKSASDFTFREKYQYFTRANIEEKTLIKVGISFNEPGWASNPRGLRGNFTNTLAIEQKLLPAVSVLAAVDSRWAHRGLLGTGYSVDLIGGVRWYYSINKRMKEGKSANNFSNFYLSLQSNNYLYNTLETSGQRNSVSLLFGKQARLGKFGYFDASIGPGIQTGRLQPEQGRLLIDFKVTVGFGL